MKKSTLKQYALGNSAFVTGAVILGFSAGMAMAGDAPTLDISGKVTVVYDARTHKSPNYVSTTDGSSGVEGKSGSMPTGADIYMPDYLNNLIFKAKGKTDSGLQYGAKLEVLMGTEPTGIASGRAGENGFRTDEASIYFAGDWGRVELGQEDPWSSDNFYSGSKVLAGFGHWGGALASSNIFGDYSYALITQGYGNDDAKITYSSPSFNGLSFGASFIPYYPNPFTDPESELTKLFGVTADRKNNGMMNVFILGSKYDGQIGEWKVGLSGSVSRGKAESIRDVNGAKYRPIYDANSYSVGAQVGNEVWNFAGSYSNHGKALTVRDPNTYLVDVEKNITLAQFPGAGYPIGLPQVADLGISYNIGQYTKVSVGFMRSVVPTQKGAFITEAKYGSQFLAGIAGNLNTGIGTLGSVTGTGLTSSSTIDASISALKPFTANENVANAITGLNALKSVGGVNGGATIAQAAAGTAAANAAIVPDQVTKNITQTGYHVGFFTPLAEGLGTFAEYSYQQTDNGKTKNSKSSDQQILVGTLVWF